MIFYQQIGVGDCIWTNGIISQLENAKSRLGLEPLDLNDLVQDGLKISLVRNGKGEKMPFDNDSFDVILSFNPLDHCINPDKVIGGT